MNPTPSTVPARPVVHISPRGEERLRRGHPWIYRTDVAPGNAEGGETVTMLGPRDRRLGDALYSDRSQIALRVLTRGEQAADAALWRARLDAAIRFRERLGIEATAYRVVHGEADLLPSLVVDRYGDWLVVQALSQGTDRLLGEITAWLVDRLGPKGILARNDPRVRQLEGLDQSVQVLHGDVPETIEISEGGVRYAVDPWKGQKTGLFLDQRENREAAARYARGRVLDAFSYNGGFAFALAPHAAEVLALDISADAVARISRNAEVNGVSTVAAREVNVFDELRHFERSGERFDTIVLDPPAFAKNKASVPKAISGYKDINLRALRILAPGGTLVTCSCSYHVDEALFLEIVSEAAADARASVTILEKRMQGRDHPVLVGVAETYYLKCLILRKLE
jgi:23S rRNA (cytosine1962-C5)-methyltransferase